MLAFINLTNETKGYRFAEWDEDVTGMRRGDIFRACQREHGRCVSAVYVDTPAGPQAVGWYFERRDYYTDTGAPYIRGAWVELVDNERPIV